MEPDKNTTTPEGGATSPESQAPADALSRSPDDLGDEAANQTPSPSDPKNDGPKVKKPSAIKRFFRKVNVYFLIFALIVVGAGIFSIVNYLNSQRAAPVPDIASQDIDEETLRELANNNATVGDTSQTLTIQGNAVIAGQTLMRGDLDIAGNLQTGGSIQAPSITISGEANLGSAQIESLQVATNTAIQGTTTVRDLNVAGAASFSGALSASQITVTNLVLSGNARLEVPNHLSFTGPSPSRSINSGVLGGGGSASIDGSDTSGTINVNTGSGTRAGCFAQITFNQPFPSRPHVIVSPVGQAAGQTQFYVTRTNTGFSICTANAAPANQSFAYDYFVAG